MTRNEEINLALVHSNILAGDNGLEIWQDHSYNYDILPFSSNVFHSLRERTICFNGT